MSVEVGSDDPNKLVKEATAKTPEIVWVEHTT